MIQGYSTRVKQTFGIKIEEYFIIIAQKTERFNTEITEKAPRYNEILGAFSVISVLNLSALSEMNILEGVLFIREKLGPLAILKIFIPGGIS